MTCRLCAEFYHQHPLEADGSHHLDDLCSMAAIRCAFPEGSYSPDNWNCQTMDRLRWLAGEDRENDAVEGFTAYWRNDMVSGSFGAIEIPEPPGGNPDAIQGGYVVMTWYKRHGAMGQAWVMLDDLAPEPLTRATAEWILACRP